MLVSLKAQHNAQNKFRQDINGLRAWAVIAVVLYHFGVPGFSGGFIGVDVFFVISGFLMTKIIVSGIEVGDFSLLRFYLARARRIIPMLLVLCLSLIILGWFWLPESNYKTLATHVLTAILFISNIKFWRESGYFDSSSHEKWLLHTWSLSVEWQFYIILPVFILIVWNLLSYRAMKTSLFIVGFISLFLSYYASYQWPAAAFYLLPTRIWEMLAGGLVWWSTRKNSLSINLSRLTEIIGFIFIVSSIILFDSSMVWPGVYAALPVLGAMLVLSAKRSESLFTSNNLVQRLGTSSYSIYLWHWPIVVGLTYLGFQGSYKWVLLGIIVTVLLGELSLKLIENPARKLFSKFSITSNIVYMSFGIIFILIISLVIKYNTFDRGIRSNEETIQLYTEIQSFHVMPKRDNGYCFYDLNSESNPIISESKSVCKIGDNS
ncbi:TPA: acyltransferase, partial [Yersinia enterocolitica]|nr:acyltransferase [Yersinia enterocolitica]